MPYARNADLPNSVKNPLSSSAQTIFRQTFNAVLAEQHDEDTARKAGWANVKRHGWRKGKSGKWEYHKTLDTTRGKKQGD